MSLWTASNGRPTCTTPSGGELRSTIEIRAHEAGAQIVIDGKLTAAGFMGGFLQAKRAGWSSNRCSSMISFPSWTSGALTRMPLPRHYRG